MKISIINRDMCRVGSNFLHVVGTNPERETIIGAGAEQILDIFDGGEAINIICAAHETEEVLVQGVMTTVNKPKIIEGQWFDRNLPEDQWPTPENLAKKQEEQEKAAKAKDRQEDEGRNQAEQHPSPTYGASPGAVAAARAREAKEEGGKPKVNLTNR